MKYMEKVLKIFPSILVIAFLISFAASKIQEARFYHYLNNYEENKHEMQDKNEEEEINLDELYYDDLHENEEFLQYKYKDNNGDVHFNYTGSADSKVVIPDGVKYMNFADNYCVEYVYIPASVVGGNCARVFEGEGDNNYYDTLYRCHNLKRVEVQDSSKRLRTTNNGTVLYNGGFNVWSATERIPQDISDNESQKLTQSASKIYLENDYEISYILHEGKFKVGYGDGQILPGKYYVWVDSDKYYQYMPSLIFHMMKRRAPQSISIGGDQGANKYLNIKVLSFDLEENDYVEFWDSPFEGSVTLYQEP